MTIARLMQQAAAGSAGAGPEPSGWTDPDLGNASYDSVSFSVAGQDTTPQALSFKPDGTKMYVLGDSGNDVNEYDLGTAWDISTALYVQRFAVGSQDRTPLGFFLKPDGTKMYVTGNVGDDVNEYDLSTAWDISTASYVQNFSVSGQDSVPTGVFFKPDGTKMYVLGDVYRDLYEYDLSTAWDISTASYLQNYSLTGALLHDLFISPEGTKIYVVNYNDDSVYEYSLSSAWDISTASYSSVKFSVASQEASPRGLFFKSDGSKMYAIGSTTDTIYQYSTA